MSTHTPLVDVACGSYASYAVDEAGHVWAWGLNQYGQLGLPDLVSPVSLHYSCMPVLAQAEHLRLVTVWQSRLTCCAWLVF